MMLKTGSGGTKHASLGQNELLPIRGKRGQFINGLYCLQYAPSDLQVLSVGRKQAPVHRMGHHAVDQSGSQDCLPRQVLAGAHCIGFFAASSLPVGAWMAALSGHDLKKVL